MCFIFSFHARFSLSLSLMFQLASAHRGCAREKKGCHSGVALGEFRPTEGSLEIAPPTRVLRISPPSKFGKAPRPEFDPATCRSPNSRSKMLRPVGLRPNAAATTEPPRRESCHASNCARESVNRSGRLGRRPDTRRPPATHRQARRGDDAGAAAAGWFYAKSHSRTGIRSALQQ